MALVGVISSPTKHTGSDVHLAGYSQGGMFAYQAAAFRRCKGIASLITFGSPVELGSIIGHIDSPVYPDVE